MGDIMLWVWVAAGVLFAVVEIATAGLVSIWFVGGALAGLIADLAGGSFTVQLALFAIVSALLLAATRPFVKRMQKGEASATNADRVLGMEAKVVEDIDDLAATGAVYVDGKTWSARTGDERCIPAGQTVTVQRIEGVKLFVKAVEKENRVEVVQ